MLLEYPFNFKENPIMPNDRKADINLKDKLRDVAYYGEFMGLLIDFIMDKEVKLNVPECIKEKTDEYFKENDAVLIFINECLEITNNPKDRMTLKDLHKEFLNNNNDSVIHKKLFNTGLKKHNIPTKKIGGIIYYTNIKLKIE